MRSIEFPGRKLLSVVIALALSPPASAIEIVKSSVEVKDGRYVMLGESIITAPRDFVFDVLADYDNFHKLASGVAESYYLPPGENGEVRGYVRVESCVLIGRVDDVEIALGEGASEAEPGWTTTDDDEVVPHSTLPRESNASTASGP